jgi:hypothetical protein
MEAYSALRPFVALCAVATEEELQQFTGQCGPMLIAEVVAAAWKTNTHPGIFMWIAAHVKNTSESTATPPPTEETVWAILVQLIKVPPSPTQTAQLQYFLTHCHISARTIWETVCYPWLPPLAALQALVNIISAIQKQQPDLQTWMWIWQAGWQIGNAPIATWAMKQGNIKLATLPPHLRTLCLFRKPLAMELVQSIPIEAIRPLLEMIIADGGIKSLIVELSGGYKKAALEFELPVATKRTTRSSSRGRECSSSRTPTAIIPLQYHPELANWYETPPVAFKLLFLGLPPAYLEKLQTTLNTLDTLGAQLINITGHTTEKSGDDKNVLMQALIGHATLHLKKSNYRRQLFHDAGLT